jgi:hypothetical protein
LNGAQVDHTLQLLRKPPGQTLTALQLPATTQL